MQSRCISQVAKRTQQNTPHRANGNVTLFSGANVSPTQRGRRFDRLASTQTKIQINFKVETKCAYRGHPPEVNNLSFSPPSSVSLSISLRLYLSLSLSLYLSPPLFISLARSLSISVVLSLSLSFPCKCCNNVLVASHTRSITAS